MPAQPLDAVRKFDELVFWRIVHKPLEKIEADASDAPRMQCVEFAIASSVAELSVP